MPSDLGYRFVLTGEAYYFVLASRASERQLLTRCFQSLSDYPYRQGDYQELDKDGREIEMLLVGAFLISFWTDHAVKEVRIMRLERV